MTAASETKKQLTLSDLWTLTVVVGFIGFILIWYFGNPFAAVMGENLLEKAAHVGVSEKAQMNAFKSAGGLDNTSSWKGFRVTELRAVYEDTGKLGVVIFLNP